MARIKTYITINAIDVSSKVVKWIETETFGNEIPDVSINMSFSVSSLLTIENGQEIIIKRGKTTGQEYNVFKGKVDTVASKGSHILVKGKGALIELIKTDVNTSFDKNIDTEAGVGSEIVKTLINDNTNLSTTSASVISTGTTVLLDIFRCKKTDIFERVRSIADIFDYQIYYNLDDDLVYFEPTGYTSNLNTLTIGSNVSNIPKWIFDNTQLVNQIRVEGAESIVETTESGQIGVTSNYTTSSVTLNNNPFSTKVFVDAANPPTTLKKGGVVDSTSTFDYYVDRENKKIIWNSTFTPGGSDYVETRYSYPNPVPIIRKRQSSIDSYGLSSTTKHFSDIQTVEDALNKANLYLDTYSEPFVRVDLYVPSIDNDYRVGQKVQIIDNYNNKNRELVINKIKKEFPHSKDILSCGNKEYALAEYNRFTLDRIKRLEEELNKNDDILVQIIDLTREINPRRRYSKISDKIKIFDSFIMGHPINGLLGIGTDLEDFETGSAASWSGSAGVTLFDDAVTFKVGTGSMKVVFASTGTKTITSTQSFGDVSTYTGVASGSPSKGTIGIWWNSANTTDITSIKLRIGSGASDYTEYTGREYRTQDGYENFGSLTFGLYTGWNYYLFDLDSPDSTTGTPDWTACDYTRFEIVVASASTGYMDYFTISKSNYIGLNGLGDRTASVETDLKITQGKMTYEEYSYDTDFHDSVNSTATFSTVTNDIAFTSGQIWYSKNFDIGTTLTFITVDLGTVVGTLKIEISSDNQSTWQEVTEGIRTAVTTSDGTGTSLRITETGATVASIDLTQDSFGQNTEPVIKVLMEE